MSKSLNVTIPITETTTRQIAADAVSQVRAALLDPANHPLDLGHRGILLDKDGHTVGHYAVQGADG